MSMCNILSNPNIIQCLQKVFIPLDLFTAWIQNGLNIFISHPSTHNTPYWQSELQKYIIYISIHTPESIHVRITFGRDYSCESFWESLEDLSTHGLYNICSFYHLKNSSSSVIGCLDNHFQVLPLDFQVDLSQLQLGHLISNSSVYLDVF